MMCDQIGILESLLTSSSEESSESDTEIYALLLREADSDTDSIDEKIITYCTQKAKRFCAQNYIKDIVPTYSDEEFLRHFRVKKKVFEQLCKKFYSSTTYQKLRPDKRCSAEVHLCVFLYFAGHNCSFRELADRFTLSSSTIYRLLDRSIEFCSSLVTDLVKWPTKDRMYETSTIFQSKTAFPNVIGAIDVTHILIDGTENCVEQHGKDSLWLQAICDEKKKFIDIFVGLPVYTHDSEIFQNSPIYSKLGELCERFQVVGDCAFPCTRNLLTPYRNNAQLSISQILYNNKLNSCRVVIEHAFGMLNHRFPQLNYCKLKNINKLTQFVQACCALHNLTDENDFNFTIEVDPTKNTESPHVKDDAVGIRLRDQLCEQLSSV